MIMTCTFIYASLRYGLVHQTPHYRHICPNCNYLFIHSPTNNTNRNGDLVILYTSSLQISHIRNHLHDYFEALTCTIIATRCNSFNPLFYKTPSKQISQFLDEFRSFTSLKLKLRIATEPLSCNNIIVHN